MYKKYRNPLWRSAINFERYYLVELCLKLFGFYWLSLTCFFYFVRTKFIRTASKTPKIKNILRTCSRLQGKIKIRIKEYNIKSQMYSFSKK